MSHSYALMCSECRDTWEAELDWVHVVGSDVKIRCGAGCGEYAMAYVVGHRVSVCCA